MVGLILMRRCTSPPQPLNSVQWKPLRDESSSNMQRVTTKSKRLRRYEGVGVVGRPGGGGPRVGPPRFVTAGGGGAAAGGGGGGGARCEVGALRRAPVE